MLSNHAALLNMKYSIVRTNVVVRGVDCFGYFSSLGGRSFTPPNFSGEKARHFRTPCMNLILEGDILYVKESGETFILEFEDYEVSGQARVAKVFKAHRVNSEITIKKTSQVPDPVTDGKTFKVVDNGTEVLQACIIPLHELTGDYLPDINSFKIVVSQTQKIQKGSLIVLGNDLSDRKAGATLTLNGVTSFIC